MAELGRDCTSNNEREASLATDIYRLEDETDDENTGYTTAEESVYICETCGIGSEEHKYSCNGCRDFNYCSNECRREHWDNEHRDKCDRSNVHTRRRFNTPCGQTYWVDDEYWIYTNRRVELPIGHWCVYDQCVYFNHGDDSSSDEEDDDYTPPPTPPPMYNESCDSGGSENDMDEVEGEEIKIGQSEC